jgi:hypothetical protein
MEFEIKESNFNKFLNLSSICYLKKKRLHLIWTFTKYIDFID